MFRAVSNFEIYSILGLERFFRLKTSDIRLIVLDEATHAMDPSEENHILDNFREMSREKGQTMIVVTHNLSSIAKHADNILCV